MNLIPKEAINQHIAIIGKTGSGKTSTAKAAIVEPLLKAGNHVAVLDPTSAWWGLRHAADGKGKGFDIVQLGGERGDLPLAERSGEAVARLITEQGVSCIIDTGGFTVGEYTRWFIAFATAIYTTIKHPLHLIIDEAHHFMPQSRAADVDGGKMLHVGNRLMSGGRSRGIRGVLITQRPAKLHKDSLTCADCLIAHRVIAPQDRAAVKDWIDGVGNANDGKGVIDTLASLKKGEAWVWYPEGSYLSCTQFPMPRTFDSSKAPTSGSRAPKATEIDLTAVKDAMAEAVREAEANDPKRLRARIAELEREANSRHVGDKAPSVDPRAIERAREDGYAEAITRVTAGLRGEIRAMEKAIQSAMKAFSAGGDQVHAMREAIGRMADRMSTSQANIAKFFPPKPSSEKPVSHTQTKREPRVTGNGTAKPIEGGWSGPQRELLSAFAWFRAFGIDEPTKGQLCFKCGWRSTSGHIKNILGSLRSAGAIEGMRLVADIAEPEIGSLHEYHEQIRSTLSGPQLLVFDHLLSVHPSSSSKEQACEALGWSTDSGHIKNVIGALRTLGVVPKGEWSLTPMVFPESLS